MGDVSTMAVPVNGEPLTIETVAAWLHGQVGDWIGYDDLVSESHRRVGLFYSHGDAVSPAGIRIRLQEQRLTERQVAVRDALAGVPDVDAVFASDDGLRVVVFVPEFSPATAELVAEAEEHLSPYQTSPMVDVHVCAHQGRAVPSHIDGLTLLFPRY